MEMKVMPIEISSSAIQKLKEIIVQQNLPSNMCCKLVAVANGCSDVNYQIAFDIPKETDAVYQKESVPFAIPKTQSLHFFGKKLDFKVEGEPNGFMFLDSNA